MKRLNVNKKVESKNDIRCYYKISNNMISLLDTLTHDYLLHLDNEEDGEKVVSNTLRTILAMDDLTYYKFILEVGVDKEYLKDCAKRYISGLKDNKHLESIEWLDKAWFDSTMQYIDKHSLGEMMPINGKKALEATLSYIEPSKPSKPYTLATDEEETKELLDNSQNDTHIEVDKIEHIEKPKRKLKLKTRK